MGVNPPNPPANVPGGDVDPAELDALFARMNNRDLGNWPRMQAKLRLIELGVIEDDTPTPKKAKVRKTFAASSAIGTPPAEFKRRAILQCLNDVEAEEYEWLWYGRIPLRTVSLIAGDGGAGKSTLTGFLATVVTTGGSWPDLPGEPIQGGSVVVLSAEENAATDIRPRYDRFGADCSRVHVVKAIDNGKGTTDRFSLTRDIPALADACRELGNVRLVMVDPVGSYLSGSDSHNDAEVQAALNPLFELADECRLAVVLVAHLTKQSSADIQSRIQGAAAFVNKARMVWFYSADPRDHARRMISFIKGNPVDKVTTALSVGLERGRLDWNPEPVAMTAKQVAFRLAKQLERGEVAGARGPVPERQAAVMELIRKRLEGGLKVPLKTIEQEAERDLEASRGTVDKAIRKLNGHIQKSGTKSRIMLEWRPELPIADADGDQAAGDKGGPAK
jgi:putative DNA primase/helicase